MEAGTDKEGIIWRDSSEPTINVDSIDMLCLYVSLLACLNKDLPVLRCFCTTMICQFDRKI